MQRFGNFVQTESVLGYLKYSSRGFYCCQAYWKFFVLGNLEIICLMQRLFQEVIISSARYSRELKIYFHASIFILIF